MRFAVMHVSHLKIPCHLVILISDFSVMMIGIGRIGLYGISQINEAVKRLAMQGGSVVAQGVDSHA
jgi:hypothetical protein